MNELGPDARAILAAARDAHDPDPATRARMRHELLRRVGAGAVVATTVAATTAKSAAAPVTALIAKLVAVAALATGGVVAVWHFTKEKPVVVAPPPPPAVVVATAAPSAIPPPPPPPALTVIEEAQPQPIAKPSVVAAAKPKEVPVPESTLDSELRALRAAHVALREGRASEALSIVDGIKGSTLGPERMAVRALALCALGRADARELAETFLASYPSSPLAKRVRAKCAIE